MIKTDPFRLTTRTSVFSDGTPVVWVLDTATGRGAYWNREYARQIFVNDTWL